MAWSCFGPSFFSRVSTSSGIAIGIPHFPLTPRRRAWLKALEHDPTELGNYLSANCRSRRLGLVYEALWHFFIERDEETRLIAHNIAVRDAKGRSLGEFDVLYENRVSGEVYHLELAVKFFLELPTPLTANPLSRWLGPNSADRLDLKLTRLLKHQLPLAHTPEGLHSLHALGVQQFSSQLQVGGILFRQPTPHATDTPLCSGGICLSENYLQGDWQSVEAMDKPGGEWRMLQKPDWLGASFDTATPVTEQTLRECVSKRPIMLINTHNQRRFIVPQGWPQH